MDRTLRIALLGLALLLLAGSAWAASGGPYEVSWYAVAAGGGTSTGSDYTLGCTAGQAAAGVMAGGEYRLAGGFAAGGDVAPPQRYPIYLPLVTRGTF